MFRTLTKTSALAAVIALQTDVKISNSRRAKREGNVRKENESNLLQMKQTVREKDNANASETLTASVDARGAVAAGPRTTQAGALLDKEERDSAKHQVKHAASYLLVNPKPGGAAPTTDASAKPEASASQDAVAAAPATDATVLSKEGSIRGSAGDEVTPHQDTAASETALKASDDVSPSTHPASASTQVLLSAKVHQHNLPGDSAGPDGVTERIPPANKVATGVDNDSTNDSLKAEDAACMPKKNSSVCVADEKCDWFKMNLVDAKVEDRETVKKYKHKTKDGSSEGHICASKQHPKDKIFTKTFVSIDNTCKPETCEETGEEGKPAFVNYIPRPPNSPCDLDSDQKPDCGIKACCTTSCSTFACEKINSKIQGVMLQNRLQPETVMHNCPINDLECLQKECCEFPCPADSLKKTKHMPFTQWPMVYSGSAVEIECFKRKCLKDGKGGAYMQVSFMASPFCATANGKSDLATRDERLTFSESVGSEGVRDERFVETKMCPADGVWPEVAAMASGRFYAVFGCEKRLCKYNGQWDPPELLSEDCAPKHLPEGVKVLGKDKLEAGQGGSTRAHVLGLVLGLAVLLA